LACRRRADTQAASTAARSVLIGQREIVDRLGAYRQNSETITRTIDRMIGRLHERFGISADVLVRVDAEGTARPAR
jgi:hypothetical protein